MEKFMTAPSNHGRPLPPVETRWKKGISGNPRGRPKKEARSYLINTCKLLWSRGIAFSALQKGPYSLAFRKGVPKRFVLDASFHPFMR